MLLLSSIKLHVQKFSCKLLKILYTLQVFKFALGLNFISPSFGVW